MNQAIKDFGGRMKEYEITKTVILKFVVEAETEEEAKEMGWTVDDRNAVWYDVYDIEVEDA